MKIIISGADSQLAKTINSYEHKNFKKYELYFFNKKYLDITDYNLLKKKFIDIQPNLFINCSAYTDVISSEKNLFLSDNINHLSLKNICDLCNKYNSTLIHFSTDYVFDGNQNKKYTETDITNPLSVYGKTKLNGEKIITKYSNSYIILRVSWLFSEYKKNFYKFVFNKLQNNENIFAVNDLFSIPTSAKEVSKFLYYLLNNYNEIKISKKINNIFHFVNSGPIVSWFEFANYIKKNFLEFSYTNSLITPISSFDFFKNEIRPKFSALNNNKIINLFEYKIENWHNSINSLIIKDLNL